MFAKFLVYCAGLSLINLIYVSRDVEVKYFELTKYECWLAMAYFYDRGFVNSLMKLSIWDRLCLDQVIARCTNSPEHRRLM